jgi:hypothetical protein
VHQCAQWVHVSSSVPQTTIKPYLCVGLQHKNHVVASNERQSPQLPRLPLARAVIALGFCKHPKRIELGSLRFFIRAELSDPAVDSPKGNRASVKVTSAYLMQ